MGVDEASCIVAGDSLNDVSLFESGFRGIVVGNCEPALPARVGQMEGVYSARGEGAAGIVEGLRYFGHGSAVMGEGRTHGE
jgi:hydroxymethylpyrimidine pyrophosphatase-like HAD family hydrolase